MRSDVAVLLTAYRRPNYLRKTLASWAQVRGIEDVEMVICLEPSDRQGQMLEVISEYRKRLNFTVNANPQVLGVDVNIATWADRLFRSRPELNYMVFAEEDLIVSDDTLEYFRWCDEQFRDRRDVLVVNGHTDDDAPAAADPAEVVLGQRFRCWIWATWRDRWEQTVFPTWDWNTATSEYPGDPCDWAWNMDLRVIPRGAFRTVIPAASRSQNIGKWEGVHAHPGLFDKTHNPSFRMEREPVEYRLVREEEILPPGTRKYHRD